ncbi:hypothetical protein ND486_28320 [Pseudonocardia sp. DR1-2]|uniref:hypothetical protein n=1 Tax=Pseudonocardia sp. DR1-2 TaxID=2951168 RepID=UPI00204417FE|nr:hypothetical protein [Pseudonocardia sp. DR1-2]MCM3850104.1 hypothetical protein [Pseudonocardia sp. DR1-2]
MLLVGGAVVGFGVPSSVGIGVSVVGGAVVKGGVVGLGAVGSGLPSSVGRGIVGGGEYGGGTVVAGGCGDVVPVCVQRNCFDVPSCVQVRTSPPAFGGVPGTVGGAGREIVGSDGGVGRSDWLACASWHAVSSAIARTPAMPTTRRTRARS